MNDKDKEAFEEWFNGDLQKLPKIHDAYERHIWQAACEYKDREYSYFVVEAKSHAQTKVDLGQLQAENKKIREALDRIDNSNNDMKYFNSDIHIIIHETREALKEIEE